MKQPVVTIGNAFSAGKELPFRPFAWCIILDYMHYGLPDAKISTVDWYERFARRYYRKLTIGQSATKTITNQRSSWFAASEGPAP